MVEATFVKELEGGAPYLDVVVLTASDGETWTSRKLGTVLGAVVQCNVNTDSVSPNVVITSGNLCTLNLNGITDQTTTLIMYGLP